MSPFWKKRKKEEIREEFFSIPEQRALWYLWDKFLREHAETREGVPFFLAGSFSYEVPDMGLLRKVADNVAKGMVGLGMLYDSQGDVFFVNRDSLRDAVNAPNAQEASNHLRDLLRELVEEQISYEISKMSAREVAPALFGEHQQFIQRLRSRIDPKASAIGCSILNLKIERIETSEEWRVKLFDVISPPVIQSARVEVKVDLNQLIEQMRQGGLTVEFKCPHCGGRLEASGMSNAEELKVCKYCNALIETVTLSQLLREALGNRSERK